MADVAPVVGLVASIASLIDLAQAGQLADEVVNTLQSSITSTSSQLSVLQTWLSQSSPLIDTSRVQQIHAQPSVAQQGHYFSSVSAHDRSNLVVGDVYNYGILFGQNQEPDEVKAFGLCLGSAPRIDPTDFIGRAAEIDAMSQILLPGDSSIEQRRLVLGGMGGIGKTQLAIAYAHRYRLCYTSLFWLNATSELTLKASFRAVARRLHEAQELERLDDEQILARAHDWLSDTRNTRWLLILDNYDEPARFNIDNYCPYSGHGSVVITTRLPDLVSGRQVPVQPFSNIEESLEILQTRSRRDNVKYNLDAVRLAERLDGLPLALATAGSYLRKSTFSFKQYLQEYDRRWNIDPLRPLQLREYQGRTLYNTWNVSYARLNIDDPDAAKTLKLLAYFDNQEIWYGLLHAGVAYDLPMWLQELVVDQVSFESAMRMLVDYCLIEVRTATQSYSVHSCVHDWIPAGLNKVIDPRLYWYSFDCVAASIDKTNYQDLGLLRYARLTRHAVRLVHHRFNEYALFNAITLNRLDKAVFISELLRQQVELTAAEQMYLRALAGCEKVLGPDHTSTLDTVNNFSNLYKDQGKLNKAEQMYLRALTGCEKALGPEHTSTLETVSNLGILYQVQGKVDEAEQMYLRALASYEKALGLEHKSTLDTVHNLGVLYLIQCKLDEAEQMHLRALAGFEKALGPEHTSTLDTVHNLGGLYRIQGKLDEAEQMYLRALAGFENELGPGHTSTLGTVYNLGNLYKDQGKLHEAEHILRRTKQNNTFEI